MGQVLGLEVKVYTGSDQAATREKYQNVQRHRCDARMEDLCRSLAAGWSEMRENVPQAWRNMRECYAAEEG